MVKVGFICEGATEKIILESKNFKDFLKGINIDFIKAVDTTGNGNLIPRNITSFIKDLEKIGVDKIFILADLDKDVCVTKTKETVNAPEGIIVIVAKQAIEAWFLADSKMLSGLFKENRFEFEYPEKESDPQKKLKDLFFKKTGRGIGDSKPLLANRMIMNGFAIQNAATHPNCSSAAYFINKLRAISAG